MLPGGRALRISPARWRMFNDDFVASPCIRVCRLDAAGICAGCRRSVTEIAAWAGADAGTRRAILATARRRAGRGASGPQEAG